jgi:hypothetical protein
MTDQDKQEPPLPSPVDVLVFRAGRWHLRDGNRFARRPYYLDLTSGRLIEPGDDHSEHSSGHLRSTDQR